MLTKLEIDSFKAFEHTEIGFRPFTAIIGPNGTGKTSVLQAIELLGAMARQQLAEVLAGRHWTYGDLPRLHADSKEFGFKAQLDLSGHAIDWSLRFGKRRRPGIATDDREFCQPGV